MQGLLQKVGSDIFAINEFVQTRKLPSLVAQLIYRQETIRSADRNRKTRTPNHHA